MAKEVHLYMAGNDPFKLPLGGTTFYIHTGIPEQGAPPPPTETPTTGGLVKQTPLGGVFGRYILAPGNAEDMRQLIDDQADHDELEFGLAVETSLREPDGGRQLPSVLEGLARSQASNVTVHLLPVDNDDAHG